MPGNITLFDVPSKHGKAWSVFGWRTRMALNYKGIPHEVKWLEFPDIAPTLESFGLAPNPPSPLFKPYTVPAIKHPSAGYIMESNVIVKELEKLHPEPSLHLDNGYYDKARASVEEAIHSLLPEIVPRISFTILNEGSIEYFNRTRGELLGMPVSEILKSDKAGENAWAAAKPGLEKMKSLLMENSSGPYLDGGQVSYADFIFASFYVFFERVHGESFERLISYDECFKRHYEACRKWIPD
ncbi:hypothetical protein LI328DRAFT_158700 [Trichoderma asperelloides]|nr:hypothetical protein LI328DRAFT_158700 [Trichoderma asperelloides]